MLVKSVVIAGTLSVFAGFPFVLSNLFELPVRMSVGPVAAVFEPHEPVDLDLNAECMMRACPMMALEIGESFRLGF